MYRWADRAFVLGAGGIVCFVALVFAAVPVVYDEMHLADTLFLASLGWRIYGGASPVLDFGHFYGGVIGQYIAWAFQIFGPTIKALDYAVLLQFATVLALAAAVGFRRIDRFAFWALVLLVSAVVLARAPLEMQTAVTGISSGHSFVYNRFAIALALVVIVFALAPATTPTAELVAALLCGAAVFLIALIKPTFASFAPAPLIALLLQGRWRSALGLVAGATAALMLFDPWAQKYLGSLEYLFASVEGRGTNPLHIVAKGIKQLLVHPAEFLLTLAALAIVVFQDVRASWRVAAGAVVLAGGYIGMTMTMGGEGILGQLALPVFAVLSVTVSEWARRYGFATAFVIKGIGLVLVVAFAVPQLANSALAGVRAWTKQDLVLIEDGPLSGYLAWSRDFTVEGEPMRRPLPLDTVVGAAEQHQRSGRQLNVGVQYAMLVDGFSELRRIDDVSRYGIVSDYGIHFDFALGAPPVLGFPIWPVLHSPELASGDPLPGSVDIVLVLRHSEGGFSLFLREQTRGQFALCRSTRLWDIYARTSSGVSGCSN